MILEYDQLYEILESKTNDEGLCLLKLYCILV